MVLSGGKSSRMGQDKSCLVLGDHTMLEKSVGLLKQLELDDVFVSGNQYDIPDIQANKGPVGGLYSAIKKLGLTEGDSIIVVPNDMPLMKKDVIELLIIESDKHKCTVVYQDQPMPLCLYISAKLVKRMQEITSSSGMSIRYLIEADKVKSLQSSSSLVFSNVNTPEELESTKKHFQ